jgi:serine/threonine protein kinase
MQLIEGKTLREYIDELPYHRRDMNDNVKIITTIVKAIVRAKKRKNLTISYGNIKPSNIIIDDHYEPFISPFNLSESLDTSTILQRLQMLLLELDDSNELKKKEYLEELAYLFPETFIQYSVNGSSPDKNAQYMLGLLAYELFTGQLPPSLEKLEDLLEEYYKPKNDSEVLKKEKSKFIELANEIIGNLEKQVYKVFENRSESLNADKNPITSKNPACPKSFEKVILKMMSPDPDDRYETLEDALNLFDNVDITLNIVKDSYTNCASNEEFDENFFSHFYGRLTEKCPDAGKMFTNLITKEQWERQHQLLKQAVLLLFAYYEHDKRFFDKHKKEEPNLLSAIAKTHSNRKITKALYDCFVKALIATVTEFDPFCKNNEIYIQLVEKAWKKVLEPGIEYMLSK